MQKIRIVALILLLFVQFTACQKGESETISLEKAEFESTDESMEHNEESTSDINYIFVHVCGAVNCEGVYELPNGSRVYQAIELAGGFREDADTQAVNQAEVLSDEQKLYIPMMGEEYSTVSEEEGKININKASKEELMTLPGVGESRADSILKYREEVGAFKSIDDIMQVSGIKEGLFEKIKNLITI